MNPCHNIALLNVNRLFLLNQLSLLGEYGIGLGTVWPGYGIELGTVLGWIKYWSGYGMAWLRY